MLRDVSKHPVTGADSLKVRLSEAQEEIAKLQRALESGRLRMAYLQGQAALLTELTAGSAEAEEG